MPHFLNNLVEIKASGATHVVKLLLGVSKALVKYFHSNKSSLLYQFSMRS